MSDEATTSQRRSHLTAGDERELRELLEGEKARLLRQYETDVVREREIVFDEAEDFVDRAEKSRGREELSALTEADRERILLVEEALERLAGGRYGLCFADDEPISVSRLRAVPWARYCARHQSELETGRLEPA